MSTKTVSKGITRFDLDNRKGYLVRISRNGERINRYFSDKTHGGKRRALQIAKEAYRSLEEELGPAENSTKNRLTQRNSTGVVGVHVAYSADNRYEGCEYYAYCASWVTESGKRQKISFAWNRYGKSTAWDLAVLARELENNRRDEVVRLYEQSAKKSAKKSKKSREKKKSKKSVKRTSAAKKPLKRASSRPAKKPAKTKTTKARKVSKRSATKKSVKKTTRKKTSGKKSTRKKTTKKRSSRR